MSPVYRPESFYESTLATALAATDTTISVTTAPNETSGYLVIEANTSNREIIKYTGVTGTTLTGCVRGLAEYGSDDSGGTGKAHSAGVDIANRDVHYYYAQYYDFLTGASATGSNAMRIGDGNALSAANRLWYANTTSVSAFWGLSSNGRVVVSEDGITSYVISAGGSGIAAGEAVRIDTGVLSVDRLSTGGLALSADKLAIGVSSGLFRVSNAVGVDTTSSMTWSGDQTWSGNAIFTGSVTGVNIQTTALNAGETIDGTTTPVPVYIGLSDGELYKADANVESTQSGDIIGVVTNSTSDGNNANLVSDGFLSIPSQTLEETISETTDQSANVTGNDIWTANDTLDKMSFAFRAGDKVGNISKIILKMSKGGSPTGNMVIDIYNIDSNGKPSGSILGTSDNLDVSTIGTDADVTFTFTTPVDITPGQKLAYVLNFSGVTFSSGNLVQRGKSAEDGYSFVGETANKLHQSADGGSTWAAVSNQTPYFTTYYTQLEHTYGDNIWLSETAGEITLAYPTSNVPLIKVGELINQTLLRVDNSNKRKFLGSIQSTGGTNTITTFNVPPRAYEVVIDMFNNTTRDTRQQIILRKNEITTQTISDDNGTGSFNITAQWTGGVIEITAPTDSDSNLYFYSY